MFNESIENSFTLTLDSWTTERRTVNTGLEYQIDLRSSSDNKSPNLSTAVDQTEAQAGVPNERVDGAVFDHLVVRKFCEEINGVRYPKYVIDPDHSKND